LTRPRVLVYGGLWAALIVSLLVSLGMRTPYKVDVVRDRGTLSRIVGDGYLQNVYRLQVMNATETLQKFSVSVPDLKGVRVTGQTGFEVGPAQALWVVVQVDIPYGSQPPGSHAFHFEIKADPQGPVLSEKSVFLVPR
jgi:polyferredoxin